MITFNLIIPTHRKNYLEKNIGSILNQKQLPNSVTLIFDKYYDPKFEKLLLDKGIKTIVYHSIDIGLTGPISAFKNCFKVIELNYRNKLILKNDKNYFQILEDDVSYITNNIISIYLKIISKYNTKFIYSNVADFYDGSYIDKPILKKEEIVSLDDLKKIDYTKVLIDTCGIIFSANNKEIKEFNIYLKDKYYCLNGDIYYYSWFLNNNLKYETIIINRHYIKSNIHSNQVSTNLNLQMHNSGYWWYKSLPHQIKKNFGNQLKKELRYCNLYSIICSIIILKPILIRPQQSITYMQLRKFLREIYDINNIKSDVLLDSIENKYITIFENNKFLPYYILSQVAFENKNSMDSLSLSYIGFNLKLLKDLYPNEYKYLEDFYEK